MYTVIKIVGNLRLIKHRFFEMYFLHVRNGNYLLLSRIDDCTLI